MTTDRATSEVRVDSVGHLVQRVQVLIGAVTFQDTTAIEHAISGFEQLHVTAASVIEDLILRGILADCYLHCEIVLNGVIGESIMNRVRRTYFLQQQLTPTSFAAAMRSLTFELQAAQSRAPYYRAHQWLEEHWNDSQPIDDLAVTIGIHPRALRRQFALHFGVTPNEYRRRCRARHAFELLKQNEFKVDAIAQMVGVASRSTLYRLLKTYSGLPGAAGRHQKGGVRRSVVAIGMVPLTSSQAANVAHEARLHSSRVGS